MKATFTTTLLQAEGKNATGIQVPAEAEVWIRWTRPQTSQKLVVKT